MSHGMVNFDYKVWCSDFRISFILCIFFVVVSLYNGVATKKAKLLSETKCVPGSYQEKKLVLSYVNLYLFGTT